MGLNHKQGDCKPRDHMCISNDGIEDGDRLGAAGSLDHGNQTSFRPTGQMALAHVEPRPLASQQSISGVACSRCGSVPLSPISCYPPPTWCGPTSHSLVIEVFGAEVVKEFIHDLVVAHDLHNPLLHVQAAMRTTCAWEDNRTRLPRVVGCYGEAALFRRGEAWDGEVDGSCKASFELGGPGAVATTSPTSSPRPMPSALPTSQTAELRISTVHPASQPSEPSCPLCVHLSPSFPAPAPPAPSGPVSPPAPPASRGHPSSTREAQPAPRCCWASRRFCG